MCLAWVAVLAGYESTAAEELIPEEQAGKRLLLQMVEVAKKNNYTKAEILEYAGVGQLSELSTEQVDNLRQMMESHEPLVAEPDW